jgi:NAD(P)-dependent dehydrogenase (short-subunit alcohol dehydrogenase family)
MHSLPGKEPKKGGETVRVADCSLAGKTAVITGANRGIGHAIATLFAREGARCAMLVRTQSEVDELAADRAAAVPGSSVRVADVTSESSANEAAKNVADEFGAIDLLVNNAGVLLAEDRASSAGTMKTQTLHATLAVNLFGAVQICNAFLPHVKDGGRIINVSSTMGQLSDGAAGYSPAYCISKTALNAYTVALAQALSSRDILVDSFHPGWAKTRMGGPNANVEVTESAQMALFLATRPRDGRTGLFWRYPGVVIDW